METHFIREARPGKGLDFKIIVQEFDELESPGPNISDLMRLFDGVEMEPDVMDAAPGRPDDYVEILEAIDEVGFGGGGIFLATAVGHRLPATGLIQRVFDRAAELLEEFGVDTSDALAVPDAAVPVTRCVI